MRRLVQLIEKKGWCALPDECGFGMHLREYEFLAVFQDDTDECFEEGVSLRPGYYTGLGIPLSIALYGDSIFYSLDRDLEPEDLIPYIRADILEGVPIQEAFDLVGKFLDFYHREDITIAELKKLYLRKFGGTPQEIEFLNS